MKKLFVVLLAITVCIVMPVMAQDKEIEKKEEQRKLEEKIEAMRGIKRKMLAARNARQEVVAKAREIISQAEAEHEAVFETLFEINSQYKSLQKNFLVEKFGSASNIPRNWQNELGAGLISEGELGWLR